MTERDRITELEHRIGQATMEAGSWRMMPGWMPCAEAGERILSALDVPRPEWPAAPAREPLVLPPDEFAALKRSARILASIVARNHQVMEAARIEMRQAGAHAAMQWILNSLPDVWDDPETEWDGKESAGAWFDRTESFYRASESAAEALGDPDPSADPSRALARSHESTRQRAGTPEPAPDTGGMTYAALERATERMRAAEGKLANLRSLAEGCRELASNGRDLDANCTASAAYRAVAGDMLAIIGTGEGTSPLSPAQCDRLRQMVSEYQDAISAVRAGLEMTAALDDADRAVIAAARDALRVLEGAGEADRG